jgi:dihydroorotate dehydrogenase (fumarate)
MDLSTTYMGMKLKNPIVPSASPLSRHVDNVKRMEDAGAAAVVLYSLFEEQIVHESLALDHFISHGEHTYAEALSYFPTLNEFNLGPNEYLEHIFRVKQAVDIPVIASLNGVSLGGWIEYAKWMEQAGADGLELNLYFVVTNPDLTSDAVEQDYVDVLTAVKQAITIPVAMKLSPYFSSLPNLARRLDQAGADALVMFNRFYQPALDIDALEVVPHLVLSSPEESKLPIRWVAILYGHLAASMAVTSGIHTPENVIQAIMAGADVTNVCSMLLKSNVAKMDWLIRSVTWWMEEHGYHSLAEMKGSLSQKSCAEPGAFERANYMKALNEFRV